MKQNSKKLLAFLLVLLIFGLAIGNMVKAETAHVFSFYAYDYDPLEDAGTEDEYPDGGNVEPGKVIALDIMYEVGSDTKTGVQIGVVYDSSVVEPLTDEGEIIYDKYTENTNNGGIWPPEGTGRTTKNTTTWNYSSLGQVGNRLNLVVTDSSGTHPLVASGKIATLYFKVLDSATPGTTFKFEYDPDNTMLSYSPLTVREDLELNVYGEVSSNTKLDTLSVKSGTTEYTLTPTFTSGTADKEFSTVVPNSVSSVDIAATMVDPSGTIASGTGANALSVGENTISIIAQAQSGDEETYKVKVYRLNNDATLSSLSLTAIDIGEFKSNVTSYTALVPYSTSTTSVSATPTDSNASINSGSGSWSLTNTGATTNDRDVIVYAENCDSKYSSVPNNSCTQKTYSISITRTAASTNNDLKSLTVDGTSVPSFSASTTEYDIGTVSNATTSINLQAEVADTNKATITTTLGNKSLAVGDNTLTSNSKIRKRSN